MTDPFKPSEVEPTSLMIGTYSSWCIGLELDDDLYSLKYAFLQGDTRIELDGAFTDNAWTFIANSAFTTTLETGRHNLDLIAVRILDSEEKIIRTSTITCFATQSDRASHAQTMVDKIESIMSGRADDDVESYTIKSRSISKMSVSELTKWREYYLAELGREPSAVTGKRQNKNTLRVGFK